MSEEKAELAGMQGFELTGAGLDSEIANFIAAMKAEDPDLGSILERNIGLLANARNDDERKRARATFNTAVKNELVKLSKTET